MHVPPTALIDAINDLDDRAAAELLALLRALTATLEYKYARALAEHDQRRRSSAQEPLWPNEEPPF